MATVADKPWWESNGIKGSLATIGASVGTLIGIATGHVPFDPIVFGTALTSLGGGCLSLYGRIRAVHRVTLGGGKARV